MSLPTISSGHIVLSGKYPEVMAIISTLKDRSNFALTQRSVMGVAFDAVGVNLLDRSRRLIRVPVNNWVGCSTLEYPSVDIITTCKGRLWCLKKTLPFFIQQYGVHHRIVVVDYGDPDGTYEWCISLRNDHVVAMRVLDETDLFNLSRARNCGAVWSDSEYICFLDADSLVRNRYVAGTLKPMLSSAVALTVRNWSVRDATTCGVCTVTRKAFEFARGYDESIEGWAPEDSDFYKRIEYNFEVRSFPASLMSGSLNHSDSDRTQFYDEKNHRLNSRRFAEKIKDPSRRVNPFGFGKCTAMICSKDTNWQDVQVVLGQE